MAKQISSIDFLAYFDRPANNLTLLEHAAIQIYAAAVSNPNYNTDKLSAAPESVANDAIYKAQVLLRQVYIEQKKSFIADRYGFESAVDTYLIPDGSKGGKSS